ncbi:MAG: TRAP transporter substrate-binding protein [Magnetococcales bacterium]|nr:TRAP transporter substrate-binding protein [Magnetococcales bacterium]
MQRRVFLKKGLVGGGAVAAAVALPEATLAEGPIHWKMATTWPKNFPGLGTGANYLASLIEEMSGGRLKVKVYGDKELVGAFEVFDAVSRGTVQMGHGAAYYWKGKHPATQFFASVPFGLTAQEMNSWLYHGGGLALWTELYEPFGLIPSPIGNTGVQMGGWFNKEIRSVDDLQGLKMRIPGLGGEVLKRAGGTPVSLPGGEIFLALQSGAIDATEWVGPYNDLAFGLHKAAKFYYYPGWHEPGTTLEGLINKKAFEALPKDLQSIVLNACKVANQDMLADLTARNNDALAQLVQQSAQGKEGHGVRVLKFPDDVLKKLRTLSEEVVAEVATADAISQKVYQSYKGFREKVAAWHLISEQAYLNARTL